MWLTDKDWEEIKMIYSLCYVYDDLFEKLLFLSRSEVAEYYLKTISGTP